MSAADDKQLEHLFKLIRVRVAHRLSDWPREQRQDVEQDAIVRLLGAIKRLGVTIERPDAYTQRLVDNTITSALREYSRRTTAVVLATELDPESNGWVDTIDQNGSEPVDIAAAREIESNYRLTAKQKNLLSLKSTLGTTEAVATYLGIPLQTARERVSRLHRTIRDQISEQRAA